MLSFNLLALLTIIITFKGVFGHDDLDWFTVASRTCPHESDMEQRLAELFQAIYFRSSNNPFPFTAPSPSFGDLLKNRIFGPNKATITVPKTIKHSAPYFTYGEFQADLLDLSKHAVWYTMDIIQNGGAPDATSPDGEMYGVPSTVSFEEFLSALPVTVDLVPASQYYWCDDEHAWGFGAGTVFIKEQECGGKAYVGRAQLTTTFENVPNFMGNDEWMLVELAIFWEIYSEKRIKCDSSDELSLNTSSWEITLSLSNPWILSIAIILVLILLCNMYMVYRMNCDKQQKYGYKSVKRIDSENYDSERNAINA